MQVHMYLSQILRLTWMPTAIPPYCESPVWSWHVGSITIQLTGGFERVPQFSSYRLHFAAVPCFRAENRSLCSYH